ncbi:MAG: transketolase [Deltaproteobacteria bacterium]|nr:transketolase [Deltaproteobacteria bacterium]
MEIKREEVIGDFRIAVRSREASLLGWNEVFSGKAKFGIFGDGKEVAQVAMARAFRTGDFRSGYYRDQTFMMAAGMLTLEQFFAQLYAHADLEAEPATGGRCMNAHFATRSLEADGSWKRLVEMKNSSADVSPTGSQMPRLLGLAQASKMYRELEGLEGLDGFSKGGDEIAWGTIGNASCAEGMFWETINASAVLQVPMLLSIWDDGFGISVPNLFQVAKQDLSALLRGFQRNEQEPRGIDLYTVKGWDYPALCEAYLMSSEIVRREHVPTVVHVVELTQPQGHSTSGSHERYKTAERLEWEKEFDGLVRMRAWMLAEGLAEDAELAEYEAEDKKTVAEARDRAWEGYLSPIRKDVKSFVALTEAMAETSAKKELIDSTGNHLATRKSPLRRDLLAGAHKILLATRDEDTPARQEIVRWKKAQEEVALSRYSSHLYSESSSSAMKVPTVAPRYEEKARRVNGFEVLNACFDANLSRHPHLVAFGEDLGQLGDVNKGFTGLQDKYGALRVADTGIRECTIMGQAIGMAMRGLRPLAEIQYLDYLLYGVQILSDDLATLQYRTKGGQKAPVIIRTRGHRLEGIWHSGSPMASAVHLLRGMHICVPRNMTQAAGFYNTLLRGDEPALVVEVLNGYRLKEALPENIADFTVALGQPEVLRSGSDVTLVTYGACCRIAEAAAETLSTVGIEVEIIDVQTLLPFDIDGRISESVQKTNRLVVVDEDVPGGTTAYMMGEIVENQGAFAWLDSPPRALAAKAHRPPYGSDGDYFSKPNAEEIFDVIYELMHESAPQKYPLFS